MTEENGIRRAIDARLSGLTVTPQMRADILRQAREEARPRGRRKMSVSLAFALLALLLAATAYAAVRFGVLSFHENQAENDAYLSHIRPIDERIEGDHATLTVSDAVFDGTSLSLALDIEHTPNAAPVYLYPHISAQSDGRNLRTEIHGFQLVSDSLSSASSSVGTGACDGILMPLRTYEGQEERGHFNFDAALLADEDSPLRYGVADSPVAWTLTLDVLRPLYPIEICSIEQYGELCEDGSYTGTLEDYAALAAQALESGIILAQEGGSLSFFSYALPVPQGMTQAQWFTLPTNEQLIASGAFELVEQMTVTFATDAPDVAVLKTPQTFDLGDYACTVTSLSMTFARLDFALEVRGKGGNEISPAQAFSEGAGRWEFVVHTPEGAPMMSGSSTGIDADGEDNGTLRHSATYTLTQPATSVTFIPVFVAGDEDFMPDSYQPTQEDMQRAFTINLS